MDRDEYYIVINGKRTYETIALNLIMFKSFIIPWTDEEGTQFDILFVFNPLNTGRIQGGIFYDRLFVAIARDGNLWGLGINKDPIVFEYIAEKMGLSVRSSTTKKLTELINGVKDSIFNEIMNK